MALVSCDGVIINGVATAMSFTYAGIELACEGQIDIRGPEGVPSIRPFFESDKLNITVCSDESEARFAQLCKNVEFRCPVMTLLKAAEADMTVI